VVDADPARHADGTANHPQRGGGSTSTARSSRVSIAPASPRAGSPSTVSRAAWCSAGSPAATPLNARHDRAWQHRDRTARMTAVAAAHATVITVEDVAEGRGRRRVRADSPGVVPGRVRSFGHSDRSDGAGQRHREGDTNGAPSSPSPAGGGSDRRRRSGVGWRRAEYAEALPPPPDR